MMRATSPSISLLSVFVHPSCSLHALGYVQCEPLHTHWCKLLLLGNNLRKEQQENDTSQVACRHQGNEHLVLVKANLSGAATSSSSQVRGCSTAAGPTPPWAISVTVHKSVSSPASSHATTWASTTNPFPNHLATFCTTLTKSNSSPMSPASSTSTASSSSSSAYLPPRCPRPRPLPRTPRTATSGSSPSSLSPSTTFGPSPSPAPFSSSPESSARSPS